ncbi:excisionase family DNA binding domain-containing protein [Lachnospiraceae bacterium M18-1]|nr:excisionase family DNA binding domain-containing protein [Lachnospiraceae bacterium M18-1]
METKVNDTFKAYSVLEIANMLGIGKTKTREILDSNILPVTKVGRQYFTSPAAIQEFLKKNIGKEIFF